MGMLLGTRRALLGAANFINAVLFNGTTTIVNCSSEAGLDDLHDAAFTAEAWVRTDGWGAGNYGKLFWKCGAGLSVNTGWGLTLHKTLGLDAEVACLTTNGRSRSGLANWTADGAMHHIAITWDDASYNYPHTWVDGLEVGLVTNNRDGVIVTDAAQTLYMGANADVSRAIEGAIAWARLSDIVRYTSTFVPPSPSDPPAVDANTVLQYNFGEGGGTTLDNEEGTAARDGTISNGVWTKVPI